MSLTLDLDPLTERKLKSAALKSGTSSRAFVIDALKERLNAHKDQKAPKRTSIASLLEEINRGFSEEEWTYYGSLVAKRRKELLTRKELVELREMSERLETICARRMGLVAELARRRGNKLEDELRALSIEPRHV